jgi:hypothetical protein
MQTYGGVEEKPQAFSISVLDSDESYSPSGRINHEEGTPVPIE